jgi:hypothetical protein
MSDQSSIPWTYERLKQLVHDRTPEELEREYKNAAAAGNAKIISKSISSMANSAGGVVIFGVSEAHDPAIGRKRISDLEPINPAIVSPERLEDLITSNIRPKIQGLIIRPVNTPSEGVIFVVDVPQSSTIHQAEDKKYYRRRNFKSEPMEDYEIRESMHRNFYPVVNARIKLSNEYGYMTLVTMIENTGKRLVKHFAVSFHAPHAFRLGNQVWEPDLIVSDQLFSGSWRALLPESKLQRPLFPGQVRRLVLKMKPGGANYFTGLPSTLTCQLFADDMPLKEVTISVKDLQGSDWHDFTTPSEFVQLES